MRFMKSQEGLIIAGFALATVMIIALLVTYLSNRVVDMIAIQSQVFFSKQAYWNAYSGMELTTSEKIVSLDGILNTEVSFATGTITITGTTTPNAYLGGNKVATIASTGSDAGGRSRAMKLTIGDPANYALSFDGDDDHVTLIDAAAFTFNGQITFSAWVIRDIANAGHVIVSKWDETSGSEKREWAFLMEANRGPKLSIYKESDDSNLTKDVDSSPSTGVWHHLAATYDGNSVIKLYVDGVEQSGTTQTSSGSAPYQIENQTTIAVIGARTESDGNPGSFMNGMIDEVTLWNTALSTAQVQSLYIQGRDFDTNSIASGNVVGYWKLENNANDSSGNSRNGTNNGATYSGI